MIVKGNLIKAVAFTVLTVIIGVSSIIGAEKRQRAVHG